MKKGKQSVWYGLQIRRILFCVGLGLWGFNFYLKSTSYPGKSLALIGAGITGIALIFVAYRWKCPRCGKNYLEEGEDGGMRVPWSETCGHCGLPEGEDPVEWKEPVPKPLTSYPRQYPAPDPKIARRKTQENFLRVVLRDDPRVVSLKPDEQGWFRVEDLLDRAKRYRIDLKRDELDEILTEDRGCRFESGMDGELIRYKRES
ncbi:MAG: hypothetical protein RLZZ505_1694 [Verrucomicrobiota bacterium]|jgi:hypothetical protein